MEEIAILWDLDGTLLDTLQDLTGAINHALEAQGYPTHDLDTVRRFVGSGARRLAQQAVPEGGDVEAVLSGFHSYYPRHCREKTAPYPGIMQALKVIGSRHPMAIVSNKPDGAVKTLCAQYFPGIFARGESEDCPRKPAPDMVHMALKTLGVRKCIYIGDSEVDVQTAQNAHVPCISVLWGFRNRQQNAEAGAVHFCEDPARLPEIIERVAGEIYGK